MKNEQLSLVSLNFMGNLVTITVDQTATLSSETSVETYPVFYEGILLDQDEEYYYLSQSMDPSDVNIAIKKTKVVTIMIGKEEDLVTEFLNQLPIPENEGEIN